MRVLHAIPSLNMGGAERLVLDIVQGLNRMGVEAVLLCFRDANAYQEAYPEIEPIVVQQVPQLRFLRGPRAGVQELEAVVQKLAPDVVHTHLFEAELRMHMLSYRPKVWVSHLHDNMRQFRRGGLPLSRQSLVERYERFFLLERYRQEPLPRFLSISNDTSRFFQRSLPKDLASRILLFPNAIDLDRFSRSGEPKMDVLRMVNVGSFQVKKNQRFLIDVARHLEGLVDFELHFAGDGPLRAMVEEYAEDAGIAHRTYFHGNVTDMPALLKGMNVYVHSATYEPFGLVLLEAMACRLPVVCLDGQGNRDLVRQGFNGSILTRPDATAFAKAVMDVWGDPARYRAYQEEGLNTARSYSMDGYLNRLLEGYSDWLDDSPFSPVN